MVTEKRIVDGVTYTVVTDCEDNILMVVIEYPENTVILNKDYSVLWKGAAFWRSLLSDSELSCHLGTGEDF